MKLRNSYLAVVSTVSVAVVAALLSGCEPANSQPRGGMPPPEVAVVAVQGQSMFTLDPAPFEVAVARAEAALASAEARFAQTKRNSARLKPLFEAKAASQKDYDDAASAAQIAEAEVKTARANLAGARLNIGYTRVAAPVAGIAGRALRSEGNYVSGPDV